MRKMCGLSYVETTLVSILLVNLVLGKECDNSDLFDNHQCAETEVCYSGKCDCPVGHIRINDTYCQDGAKTETPKTPTPSSLVDNGGGGSIVAGILIPIAILIIVISAVYLAKKRQLFGWTGDSFSPLSWLRSKMSQRNSNYDEFMIGQDLDDDDPPLR